MDFYLEASSRPFTHGQISWNKLLKTCLVIAVCQWAMAMHIFEIAPAEAEKNNQNKGKRQGDNCMPPNFVRTFGRFRAISTVTSGQFVGPGEICVLHS